MRAIDTTNGHLTVDLITKVEGDDGQVAGALQDRVHKISRVVREVDTTNGRLSVDLSTKVESKDGLLASIHQTPGPSGQANKHSHFQPVLVSGGDELRHLQGRPVSKSYHEMHCPGFYTGVTAAFVVQSTEGSPKYS